MIKFIQDFQKHIRKAGKHLKIELFAKIVIGWKPSTIFAKRSISEVCQCSDYTPCSHMKYFIYNKSFIPFHRSLCNTDAFETFFLSVLKRPEWNVCIYFLILWELRMRQGIRHGSLICMMKNSEILQYYWILISLQKIKFTKENPKTKCYINLGSFAIQSQVLLELK